MWRINIAITLIAAFAACDNCASAGDAGCPCAGQTNCPDFLNTPFLPTGQLNITATYNGVRITTPNGLAVGPGNTYFVGNFKPRTCDSNAATCTPCDAGNPDVWCSPSKLSCCYSTPVGELVQFTLPQPGIEPTWRRVAKFTGEEIVGLAGGRDGSVMVGANVIGVAAGRLYRYEPNGGAPVLVRSFGGTVHSITQNRQSGEWYVETQDPATKVWRLGEDGADLGLPTTVPANPAGNGVLQISPDNRLYRLIGGTSSAATLETYDIP